MADDGAINKTTWPLPQFHFSVDFGDGIGVSFSEVSGLETEILPIEYKHSNSGAFSDIKMPGLKNSGNITLKRGVFTADNTFWEWLNSIQMNTIERKTIAIKLLDENGNPTITWKLANAWPIKITSKELESDRNEVAVESIELVHEGMTITQS